MKQLIFVLLLVVAAFASFDQTYVHQISRSGASTIERTADVSAFSSGLSEDAFDKMEDYCKNTIEIECSVDSDNRIVTIEDSFEVGSYYSFSADYGFPYTTYVLEISRVPTDRYSKLMESILVAIGEANESGALVSGMDLTNKEHNQAAAEAMKKLGVNLVYVVEMPTDVESAAAGTVQGTISGKTVTFDLVEVLAESEPMVIVSKEFDYGYLLAALGVIILILLAFMFVRTSKRVAKKTTKRK
jgi:hypothetical protein